MFSMYTHICIYYPLLVAGSKSRDNLIECSHFIGENKILRTFITCIKSQLGSDNTGTVSDIFNEREIKR